MIHVSRWRASRISLQAGCGFALLLFCVIGIPSCREHLPVAGSDTGVRPEFRFSPGDYFSYDNWKLDFYGFKIASSRFRNSWTVADTGQALRGWNRVSVIIDSTFDTGNRLVSRDTLLFRFDEGDVYRWGFLRSLIAERETLTLAPQWNLIAAFSQPVGSSWTIARLDTSIGAPSVQTVFGRINIDQEYVGPITINGTSRAVLSYKVEITKPRLDYTFWLTASPTVIAAVVDDSEALPNSTVRKLKVARVGQ